MIYLIDNYDSFTYNLVQEFGKLGATMTVVRNDQLTVAELAAKQPTALIVSPGPCSPSEAGISIAAILHFSGKIPVFGVCLGHQSIVQAFGGKVIHAKAVMHGKVSHLAHEGTGLFAGLAQGFEVGRYHSLAGELKSFPACLTVTATSEDGEIMALKHKDVPTVGVQFHPESVLTPQGPRLMKNWLDSLG